MSEPNSNSNQSPARNSKETPDRVKLKILAFHGYRQNGAVFRAKIGSFRKAVAKYAQLVFISAPHKVVNEDGGGDEGYLTSIKIIKYITLVVLENLVDCAI